MGFFEGFLSFRHREDIFAGVQAIFFKLFCVLSADEDKIIITEHVEESIHSDDEARFELLFENREGIGMNPESGLDHVRGRLLDDRSRDHVEFAPSFD